MPKDKMIKILEELISHKTENEWIEFKVDNYEPQLIGEYISALSNAAALHGKESGYLVYGVKDITHEIVGTEFKPYEAKVGSQELENWIATQLEPHIDFKIFELNYKEKNIVIFKIDSTYNIPVKFKNIEYIRVGSYKKKLSEFPEKERKIWGKSLQKEFEIDIALKDISDDEVLKLLDYPGYFDLMKLNLPTNKEAIIEKFIEEKLIVKTHNGYNITNLGAILFAKNLNSFDKLSRKVVRVILYKGKGRLETVKEHLVTKGYAIGFEGLIEYINNILPINEEIGKAFRKEVRMYPEIAIRELVANAIIHQDFSEKGTGPMIEIFEDRVEITNPGKPLIDTLRFVDHSPQSRNEKLAYFMRRVNICEERGSGIDKVVSATEIYQLPPPNFIEENNFFRVVLYSYKSFEEMDKKDKIMACYLHCCLKYVSNDYMTNQTLRERFNIGKNSYPMASRIIADAIEAELIKDYDAENKSKKFAKYIPFWS